MARAVEGGELELGADPSQRTARLWLLAVALICAVGVVVAIELTRVYILTNTDPSYRSFCAVSESVNCETVAASPWAHSFGVLNSVWAIFAYVWLFGLAVTGMFAREAGTWPRGVLLAVSSALVLASAVLFYIMKAIIGALCILCLALDVVNVALFVLAVAWWRTSQVGRGPVRLVLDDLRWLLRRPFAVGAVALATLGMLVGAVEYSSATEQRVVRAAAVEPKLPALHAPQRAGGDKGDLQRSSAAGAEVCDSPGCPCHDYGQDGHQHTVHMGRDDQGHQWIGAAEPQVTVEEFTDYECPFCRRAHLQLRAALARNPRGLRVVHRHYPLDHSCNPAIKGKFHLRACMLSRVAFCAGEQGRFWEMNDYLFQHAKTIRSDQLAARELAERIELDIDRFECCMQSSDTEEHIRRDIEAGRELGISGTPTYVSGGQVVSEGALSPEQLSRLMAP